MDQTALDWLRHIYSPQLLAGKLQSAWDAERTRFQHILHDCPDPVAQVDRTCTQHADGICPQGRAALALVSREREGQA